VRSGPATRENPGISLDGSEAHLRQAVEGSLSALGVERIDLYQLHRIDPATPLEETMGVLRALRDEGKIRHIGLSEVGVDQIERARAVVDIASVQNVYSLAIRKHDPVLDYCAQNGIAFIPFWPLHLEGLAGSQTLADIAQDAAATLRQVALAWLLRKSPAILLIPGTASLDHLEENLFARNVSLTTAQTAALDTLSLG